MAKKEQKKKKNYSFGDRDEQISFKDLVESRKQEMESVLPGFYTIVHDPKHKSKDVKVYSVPYMKRSMFSVNNAEE